MNTVLKNLFTHATGLVHAPGIYGDCERCDPTQFGRRRSTWSETYALTDEPVTCMACAVLPERAIHTFPIQDASSTIMVTPAPAPTGHIMAVTGTVMTASQLYPTSVTAPTKTWYGPEDLP